MANVRRATKAPTLTMNLFGPGMTPLHRAGLGGLVATIGYVDRQQRVGRLTASQLPGGPWPSGQPPWTVDSTSLTLRFDAPEDAGEFLHRLFAIAFGLKDDLIYLPGQHHVEPPVEMRAELQNGSTLAFLQHGQSRKLAKEATPYQYDPDGSGTPVVVEYRRCSWYKHQDGWQDLVDGSGCLKLEPVEVVGPLSPGSVVRHVAFSSQTTIEDLPERVLPLYFALVGCLALPVNRGVGVLLVPDVTDLVVFARTRPHMTPTAARECRIASAGDAALQAQVRLRAKGAIAAHDLPGCYTVTFRPTSWAKQQKSRVATMLVPAGQDRRLDQFDIALASLSPRIASVVRRESVGRGRQRQTIERTEYFWADSVVRPLVADNLARERPWYAEFTRLMYARDAAGQSVRRRVSFEQEGLHAMTENIPWEHESEAVLVRAVHQAIRNSLGRIRHDTDGEWKGRPSQATRNRWDRFRERLRLSLVGAKTPDQCRSALCTLFGNAGVNLELQQSWQTLLPMLASQNWQQSRDLALLALASYAGREEDTEGPANDQNES